MFRNSATFRALKFLVSGKHLMTCLLRWLQEACKRSWRIYGAGWKTRLDPCCSEVATVRSLLCKNGRRMRNLAAYSLLSPCLPLAVEISDVGPLHCRSKRYASVSKIKLVRCHDVSDS